MGVSGPGIKSEPQLQLTLELGIEPTLPQRSETLQSDSFFFFFFFGLFRAVPVEVPRLGVKSEL